MTIIELIATAFGLTCVWLYIRRNIWAWPVGLVQVALFVWIFYEARLYSDVLLHAFYIGLQLYGWYYWLAGGIQGNPLPISRLNGGKAGLWLVVAAAGTTAIGFTMYRWTEADLPYWDAATTVLSLIATYLLARKVLESWLFWISVDVLAIGIYAVKGLYVTTGLYAVFLVMATIGWFAWRRTYRTQQPACGAAEVLSSASSCLQPEATSS